MSKKTISKEAYFGAELHKLQFMEQMLRDMIRRYPAKESETGVQSILYSKYRIKEPASIICKLRKQKLPTDAATAMEKLHDIVGARIVCSFLSDVSDVTEWLYHQPECTVLEEKNYIDLPKPNGYRSLHLIVRLNEESVSNLQAEIQLRTIALDFWAALEHQMKYKRNIPHESLVRSELKRCADEIASIDMTMQTLRELIGDRKWT